MLVRTLGSGTLLLRSFLRPVPVPDPKGVFWFVAFLFSLFAFSQVYPRLGARLCSSSERVSQELMASRDSFPCGNEKTTGNKDHQMSNIPPKIEGLFLVREYEYRWDENEGECGGEKDPGG